MNRLREESGVTLTELLVTVTLMLIVLGATLTTLNEFEVNANVNRDQNDTQDRARQATALLARDLRNVASPTQSSTASTEVATVDKATAYDLVFQVVDPAGPPPAPNLPNVRRVRYCLDDSDPGNAKLRFQYQTWSDAIPPASPPTEGCPSADAGWQQMGSGGRSRVVAEKLVNTRGDADRPLFSYKATTAGCAVAPVTASCLPEIIGIRSRILVDVNGADREPAETPLETGVALRNQNRRPAAEFTSTPVGCNSFRLNATGSSDPEGETLRYEWYILGLKIGEGAIFQTPVLSAGTHTITLKAIDSGGLVASTNISVNACLL